MSHYPADQMCNPPELPSYLKNVYELKPILGVPTDVEIIKIHAVIRMANHVVGVPELHNPTLLATLSEHLFDAQMAKYRSKYPCSIFPLDTVYRPPLLPDHVPFQLDTVSGTASAEQVVKVKDAVRFYRKCAEIPPLFDPQLHAELSQHLFDIQMAKYMQSYGPSQASLKSKENDTIESACSTRIVDRVGADEHPVTNSFGARRNVTESGRSAEGLPDASIRDVVERSHRLAERAKQPIERSNRLVEQSKQLVEQLNHSSNSETLGITLNKMNKVLVGIQHAMVRNHQGNTIRALDCLVNEEGDTPAVSRIMDETAIGWMPSCYAGEPDCHLPVVIDGVTRDLYIDDLWLGGFLYFYGIGKGLCEDERNPMSKPGMEADARERLSKYWSSCLG